MTPRDTLLRALGDLASATGDTIGALVDGAHGIVAGTRSLPRLDAAWRAVEGAAEAMMTPPPTDPIDEARRATVDALVDCVHAIIAEHEPARGPAWSTHMTALLDEVRACPGPLTAARWVGALHDDQHRVPRATLHWVDARRHITRWRAALATQETDQP